MNMKRVYVAVFLEFHPCFISFFWVLWALQTKKEVSHYRKGRCYSLHVLWFELCIMLVGPRRVQLSSQEQTNREYGDLHRPRTPMDKQERISVSRKRVSPGEGLKTPEEVGRGEVHQDVRSSSLSLSSEKKAQRKRKRSITSTSEGSRLYSIPKNLQETVVVFFSPCF